MDAGRLLETKRRKRRNAIFPSSNQPLSNYSNDLMHAAAKRTEKWVNRPADVRRRETEQRYGHIARPLNSFMLYRSAYISEAKTRYSQSKQQELSVIVADSWRKESPEVRQAYEAYAMTERRNHYEAYPKYKFFPKKVVLKKGDAKSKDALKGISEDVCDPGSCPLATAANKNQTLDMPSCSIDANISMQFEVPDAFAAWQPLLLPMQPTISQDQHSNHAVQCQVAGNNALWSTMLTHSLFEGPCKALWEPPMGNLAFLTMPNTNSLLARDPSCSEAETLAGASINYTMSARASSYYG